MMGLSRTRNALARSCSTTSRTRMTRRIPMSNSTAPDTVRLIVLDEPELQFASGQHATDPHDGLGLFGPFSLDQPSHPRTPPYLVVGAPEGITLFSDWA